MTSKTIIVGLVALAFVAGSMMTVTADAKKDDATLEAIFGLVMELETQIISMQTEIISLSTGGIGPQGETGPQGEKGDKGDSGVLSVIFYQEPGDVVTVFPGIPGQSIVTCDSGDVLIGMRYDKLETLSPIIVTLINIDPNGNTGEINVFNPDTQNWNFQAFGTCFDNPPLRP